MPGEKNNSDPNSGGNPDATRWDMLKSTKPSDFDARPPMFDSRPPKFNTSPANTQSEQGEKTKAQKLKELGAALQFVEGTEERKKYLENMAAFGLKPKPAELSEAQQALVSDAALMAEYKAQAQEKAKHEKFERELDEASETAFRMEQDYLKNGGYARDTKRLLDEQRENARRLEESRRAYEKDLNDKMFGTDSPAQPQPEAPAKKGFFSRFKKG